MGCGFDRILFGLLATFVSFGTAVGAELTVVARNGVTLSTSIATDQFGQAFTMAGLSGISRVEGDRYVAVMDNSDRLVRLRISVSADGSLSAVGLDGDAGSTGLRLAAVRDFEDVASLGPGKGVVVLAEEGGPSVMAFDADSGALRASVGTPSVFAARRANFGLESLSIDRAQRVAWTANEEALSVDGPLSTQVQGTVIRLLKYDVAPGVQSFDATPVAQYAYVCGPLHAPATSGSRSGVSQVLVLPSGRVLTLERSFGLNFVQPFLTRIYEVDFAGATDVSGLAALAGAAYTPVSKRLLYSGGQTNLEGLCVGPMVSDGGRSLIGIVDDGDPISLNRVVGFVVRGDVEPSCPPDLTGDGLCDDMDFVLFAASYELFEDPVGDLNGDGFSDDTDFVEFAAAYEAFVCP